MAIYSVGLHHIYSTLLHLFQYCSIYISRVVAIYGVYGSCVKPDVIGWVAEPNSCFIICVQFLVFGGLNSKGVLAF
jgi:hypothetical protein